MTNLRKFISEVLTEDLEGFLKDTRDVKSPGYYADEEIAVPSGKAVKRAWRANADHTFFNSLVKVHWVPNIGSYERLRRLISSSGRDEISTMGYLPGKTLQSSWGGVGLQVSGRVTVASNNMDALFTGFYDDAEMDAKALQQRKSSGFSKRPGIFSQSAFKTYALDRKSFESDEIPNNELIVDNWEPISIIVNSRTVDDRTRKEIIQFGKDLHLPVLDEHLNQIS